MSHTCHRILRQRILWHAALNSRHRHRNRGNPGADARLRAKPARRPILCGPGRSSASSQGGIDVQRDRLVYRLEDRFHHPQVSALQSGGVPPSRHASICKGVSLCWPAQKIFLLPNSNGRSWPDHNAKLKMQYQSCGHRGKLWTAPISADGQANSVLRPSGA